MRSGPETRINHGMFRSRQHNVVSRMFCQAALEPQLFRWSDACPKESRGMILMRHTCRTCRQAQQ